MASPIQITNEDIKALQDRDLVQLLRQLLYLELGTNNIEKFDSQVPLSIYIKDGGIDGIARWEDGPEKTPYLPGRIVGFQAKATDMSEAACKSEVQTKDGHLKSQVRRVVESGGSYVLFLGRDCVEQSKIPRIQALKDAIESASIKGRGTALTDADVRIYDASDIAGWANAYPAAVASAAHFLGRTFDGALSWDEMSGYAPWRIPYVPFDEARSHAIEAIRQASLVSRSVVRIVGSSGLGKTRLVFEAFRPPEEPVAAPDQSRLSSLFCYIQPSKVPHIDQLVAQWRRLNRFGVVIVDDCPYELHQQLSEEVAHANSRLSLITIGNDLDASAYAGTDTKLLVIEPTTEELINSILEKAFAEISPKDRGFISSELAQGYPLMAILVAQARKADAPLSARLTSDVLAKLLGRDVAPDSIAKRVISVCALFEYLGFSGDMEYEREFVRQAFCPDVSENEFYANIVEFEKCGTVSRYGRLIQVRPRPLAIRLAADWWEKCSPALAHQIIEAEFPEGLANAFCDRLRMLDFVPALVETSARLCGEQGPFGQAKVLNSELGSRLFRAIAEVNPLAAVDALWIAFGTFDEARLECLKGGARRNLVWTLEKLCFRVDTFNKAANFLAKLAGSENETWSNNSTGVFKRLFMVLLPGTQASLEQRLPVLLGLARSESPRMRLVAVAALENAIRTRDFMGTSGPEYQGSAGPLPQYRPKLWKEVFDYWSSCLEELVRLCETDAATSEAAASAIASNIRWLILQGRLDDVETAVNRVAVAKGGVWPAAVDSVKDSLRYDSKGFPEGSTQRIGSWLTILEPADLAGKLALHVTNAPFEHEEGEDGNWRDLAAERAEQFGASCAAEWPRLIPHLSTTMRGQQRQAFMFGKGLAKGLGYSEQRFQDVVSILASLPLEERNSAILSGWLSALDEVNPGKVDIAFEQLAHRSDISQSIPAIFRGLNLNNFRTGLLTSLLHERVIAGPQLRGISCGQSMALVSPNTVSELCTELLSTGQEGAWVALDVAFMFVYSDEEKWAALAPTLRSIISSQGMLRAAMPDWQMDTHSFAVVAKKLVEHDRGLATILTTEILDTAINSKHFSKLDHCLREVLAALFGKQLDVAWPLITAALEDAENLAQWQLDDLLRDRFKEAGEGGVLAQVPFEKLANWCANSPEVAPPILARLIPVMEKANDDNWTFSTTASFLLDNYGNNPSVLSELSSNINSFTWSGSLVPFFERQITVLQSLTAHTVPEVRHWSERLIYSAMQQVRKESERDKEHELGRY